MTFQHDPFSLDCPFREGRVYVHSTSICNQLQAKLVNCDHFELVLKKWMTNRICFTPIPKIVSADSSGYLRIQNDSTTLQWNISEDADHPVVRRDQYDESALANSTQVNNTSIVSHPINGIDASFFDRLIAANKVLINTALKPDVKLIAAKVRVNGFPAADAEFTLTIASHLGKKIFKTKIMDEQAELGELVFYGE